MELTPVDEFTRTLFKKLKDILVFSDEEFNSFKGKVEKKDLEKFLISQKCKVKEFSKADDKTVKEYYLSTNRKSFPLGAIYPTLAVYRAVVDVEYNNSIFETYNITYQHLSYLSYIGEEALLEKFKNESVAELKNIMTKSKEEKLSEFFDKQIRKLEGLGNIKSDAFRTISGSTVDLYNNFFHPGLTLSDRNIKDLSIFSYALFNLIYNDGIKATSTLPIFVREFQKELLEIEPTATFKQLLVEASLAPALDTKDRLTAEEVKAAHNAVLSADKIISIKDQIMKKSFMADVTDVADRAQWRIYQRQAMKRIRDGLLLAFKDHGAEKAELNTAEKFLSSKIGEGILSAFIGFGGQHIPMLGDNPKFVKLMDEFKVEGAAVIGDDLVEKAVQMFMPMLTETMDSLPEVKLETKVKKTRIKVPGKGKDVDLEHLAEEEQAKNVVQMQRAQAKS